MAFPRFNGERIKSIFEALSAAYDMLGVIAAGDHTAAFGELPVVQRMPVAGWRFDYGVINTIVNTDVATGGTVTTSESKAQIATAASVGSRAEVSTIKTVRYTPGRGVTARFTCVFAAPAAGLVQIIGVGDTDDGFFFGYNGLDFGIMRRRDGVDAWIEQNDWSGPPLEFVPNFQRGNVFQITYQWLGFGNIDFFLEHPATGAFMMAHRIRYPNTATVTSLLNPTLPMFARIENVSNNTVAVMQTPSAMAFIEGVIPNNVNPLDIPRNVASSASVSDTNENHILTLRGKTTFLTIANRIPLATRRVIMSRESGAPRSTFRVRINATPGGALSYSDVDASNSPAEFSTTATTISAGQLVRTYPLVATNFVETLFDIGEIILAPGDTITISVENSTATGTQVSGSIDFVEEF